MNDLFLPGDRLPHGSVVDTIHCGLPWVPTASGSFIMGAVSSCNPCDADLYDAKTGRALDPVEVTERLDNPAFDYDSRAFGAERPLRERIAISWSIKDRRAFASGIPCPRWFALWIRLLICLEGAS